MNERERGKTGPFEQPYCRVSNMHVENESDIASLRIVYTNNVVSQYVIVKHKDGDSSTVCMPYAPRRMLRSSCPSQTPYQSCRAHTDMGEKFKCLSNPPPSTAPSTAPVEYPSPVHLFDPCISRCNKSIRRLFQARHHCNISNNHLSAVYVHVAGI